MRRGTEAAIQCRATAERMELRRTSASAAAACALLLLAVAAAAPSMAIGGTTEPRQAVHVLSDDFNDGVIDDEKWAQGELFDTDVVERNGWLEMIHPAIGSPADYGRYLTSWRLIRGDFDAWVEYYLVTYPVLDADGRIVELAPDTEVELSNGVRLGIRVITPGRDYHFATMERSSSGPDEAYAANFDEEVTWTGMGTRDRSGALRMQRTGSEIAAYRMVRGFWSEVKRVNVTSEDVYFELGSWGKIETFAAYDVRVAFDNLVVVESPKIVISTEPTSGTAPFAVAFSSAIVGGMAPYAYAWTFGDGGTSSRPDPTHVYRSAGNHTATLTVTDGAGQRVAESLTIQVAEAEAEETNGTVGPSTVTDGTSWIVLGIAAVAGIALAAATLRRRRGPPTGR